MKNFIYARKSSESEDRQILSIAAQLHEIREYAKKECLEIVREFTESMTAKKPGRPGFNDMITRIEKRKGLSRGTLIDWLGTQLMAEKLSILWIPGRLLI